MAPLRIFLSYRREDASGHAGRLYDALSTRFGAKNVFMDIDTIDLGADFVNVITEAVASCDVLIALIGRHWVDAVDNEGRQRLSQTDDFVRLELEAALGSDVFVIPVCVQAARQPSSEHLPETLAPLARRHGTELRDIGWHDDVKRLVERLERFERERAGPEGPRAAETPAQPSRFPRGLLRSRRLLVGVAALVVAAGATAAILAFRDGGNETGKASSGSAESELRRLIPPVTRPNCQSITWGEEAARVSLECGAPRTSVTYHLFPNNAVMDAWYAQARELAAIEPLSGSCTGERFRGEARYTVSAERVGSRFCYFDSEGEAQLFWTDSRVGVGAQANVYEGTGRPAAESLMRQWRCCLRVEP